MKRSYPKRAAVSDPQPHTSFDRIETLSRNNAELKKCNSDLLSLLTDAEEIIKDLWYSAKGNPVTGADVEAVRQRIALAVTKGGAQ